SRFFALHLFQCAESVDADGFFPVSHRLEKMAEFLGPRQVHALEDSQSTKAAQGYGGVSLTAPYGLHLHVSVAKQKGGGFIVIQVGKGFGDSVFAPALRVGCNRIPEEAVKGGKEFGNKGFQA